MVNFILFPKVSILGIEVNSQLKKVEWGGRKEIYIKGFFCCHQIDCQLPSKSSNDVTEEYCNCSYDIKHISEPKNIHEEAHDSKIAKRTMNLKLNFRITLFLQSLLKLWMESHKIPICQKDLPKFYRNKNIFSYLDNRGPWKYFRRTLFWQQSLKIQALWLYP